MGQIRVLVVDDSVFAREVIIGLLSEDSEIKIIGEAEDGREAVEMVKNLEPDIVTMDIEMPEMDGLEATERIMSSNAVPILVVTSKGDANTAYSAISKGALEVLPKPDVDPDNPQEFINKIKLLSKVKVITHIRGERNEAIVKKKALAQDLVSDRIVAIASSTGGPKALSGFLSMFPEDFPAPIVIAQHIPPDFVSGMVEWLNEITSLKIKRGDENDTLTPGTAYISPSRKHMGVNSDCGICFTEKREDDIYSPSCDILLSSAAEVYGANAIGVIMTGMGHDGVEGIKEIKKAGGITIAQDEGTSVVFGMNKLAIEDGYVDLVIPIEEIGRKILNIVIGK